MFKEFENLAKKINEIDYINSMYPDILDSYFNVKTEEEVKECLKDYENKCKNLTEICKQHIFENTSKKLGDKNLCIVHPFYHFIEFGKILPENERLIELVSTLDKGIKKILFDDIIGYILKSNVLVEKGTIDRVILTKIGDGIPLDENEMVEFKNSRINYLGGNYRHLCINEVIKELRKYAPYFSIRLLRDCIGNPSKISFFEKIKRRIKGDPLFNGNKGIYDSEGEGQDYRVYLRDACYDLFFSRTLK